MARTVKVDFRHLGAVGEHLLRLSKDIPTVRGEARTADRTVRTGGDHGDSALGSRQIDEARIVCERLRGTYTAVDANLADVATCLEQTAGAIADIVATFKTVEERSRLSVEEVRRFLPR